MNIVSMLSNVSTATVGNFETEHKILNGLIDVMSGLGLAFGSIANELCKLSVDISQNNIASAIEGISAGLVTFFMILEIITYCFNVDFHAGFESAMKIGVKTVLMYIIVDNCMKGVTAVIGIFKLGNDLNFEDSFSSIGDPIKEIMNGVIFSDGVIMQIIEPLMYGLALFIIFVALIVLFSMIIVSLIGVVMETTILTAIAPIACATLVNSQVRQTGISALKNLAAISLQWSVISISFVIYSKITPIIKFDAINSDEMKILENFFVLLPQIVCLVGLSAMISKSGEITRRALGA